VDPRDPRQGGDDQPLDTGWNAELRGRPQDQPVAPKPAWERPAPIFIRERFLLRLVAWLLGVHFSILGLAAVACAWAYIHKVAMLKDPGQEATTCPKVLVNLQDATNQGLAVLLALLGGGALAIDEQRRAKKEEDHAPADPRRGGGDQP
jgi:hypothetical protein